MRAPRRYKKSQEYKDAMADGFDVLVMGLGTNDAKTSMWPGEDAFLDDYKALLTTMRGAA